MDGAVVQSAETRRPGRSHRTVVLTGDVIGNEIDNDLESGLVRTPNQRLELLHPAIRIVGEIGVDVVIISDGVRRAGSAFDALRGCIFKAREPCGVADDARVPDVAHAEAVEVLERSLVESAETAA